MQQPARAKRPPPLVRKQQPPSAPSSSSANSLDFSIKTFDQIRAEKRKKQQLQRQEVDGDETDRREGDVAGIVRMEAMSEDEEQTDRTITQSRDKDKALKKEREEREEDEGEDDSGKELPKILAPQKRRRVIIKRSTLRKNANSASSTTTELAKSFQSEQATSLAPSPKKKHTTEDISTSDSQAINPGFDPTCIDKSVPLPDNQEQVESKLTLLLILMLEQIAMILRLYF